jgi:hypothetical protein
MDSPAAPMASATTATTEAHAAAAPFSTGLMLRRVMIITHLSAVRRPSVVPKMVTLGERDRVPHDADFALSTTLRTQSGSAGRSGPERLPPTSLRTMP